MKPANIYLKAAAMSAVWRGWWDCNPLLDTMQELGEGETVRYWQYRVAMVRENIWKMNFFQVREKSGNVVDGQGNLERTGKIQGI